MKKIILTICSVITVFILSSSTNKKCDEGMFPLSDLKNIDLQKAGLKISTPELYNPNGKSLIDGIVRVGGCTGSFISNDGLLITNHHCAFGFVQAISTTKNNYIKQGFLAKNRSEEVQAKGLVCKITASYADVSEKVLAGTQTITDAVERLSIIAANIKTITQTENKFNPDLQCEISEMFTGRTYVLFRYKLLKDVRLVYVPARSIGEYGGELDNWVWPRHSGDFSFLRAYVAPDGSAAEFNEKNIPYKPATFLKINPKGVKENDFVFILGYPGRTFRHQPAAFYKYHEQYMLKYISDIYDWQISKMDEMGKGNDSLQIKYSAKIKSLANITKNYKGKLQGFRRTGLTQQKYTDEKMLNDFINANSKLKQQYGTVIPRINLLYEEVMKFAPRNLWYDQIYNLSPIFQTAAMIDNYGKAYHLLKTDDEKKLFKDKQLPRIKASFYRLINQYDPTFEKAAFKKMLLDAQKFNKDNEVKFVSAFMNDIKNEIDLDKKIETLYAKTKIKNISDIGKLVENDPEKLFKLKDPLIAFASQLNTEVNFYDEEDKKRDSEINLLMAKYVDMKSAWKEKQFVPDANGTLRFTFGSIKGYSPNDAEYQKPITTLTGVIQKEDGKDYELLDVIKELYAAKDFGTYIHPDLNDLPVNILYDLDTTGGNSGSPVMNAYGDLIGVNFDRAYTATINDYAWNESYSRSVAVDIRYVLWIVQKVAKAQNIIDELTMVNR
ncbi:MAG: S46 family peptidase [Bacteroidota bacterium]